jgi:ferredoxin-thioredoxin reductase catalytic subunit
MVHQRAEADAKTYDYYLNPDPEFLKNLLEGLKQNEERYGYLHAHADWLLENSSLTET